MRGSEALGISTHEYSNSSTGNSGFTVSWCEWATSCCEAGKGIGDAGWRPAVAGGCPRRDASSPTPALLARTPHVSNDNSHVRHSARAAASPPPLITPAMDITHTFRVCGGPCDVATPINIIGGLYLRGIWYGEACLFKNGYREPHVCYDEIGLMCSKYVKLSTLGRADLVLWSLKRLACEVAFQIGKEDDFPRSSSLSSSAVRFNLSRMSRHGLDTHLFELGRWIYSVT